MPSRPEDNDTGSLERARERLYEPDAVIHDIRAPFSSSDKQSLPHLWKEDSLSVALLRHGGRHVRFAGIFFVAALLFFLISLASVGYFFYYGGNSVSVDNIDISVQGPTTISSGDTTPLSFTVTNKNSVAIENAVIEIDFPSGTRKADDVLIAYPRYVEDLGTLASGATITRSVKAVLFGGTGENLSVPISFSYGAAGSNATFVKKSSYALAISSTPLSLSVDALSETVAGKPLTLILTVRSNATVPIQNVVLASSFPFGFSVVSSSLPLTNASFLLGTLLPGTQKTITLTGTLTGQNQEERTFSFAIGTAKTEQDQTLAVTYMTQKVATVITAPFINTSIAINNDTRETPIVAPGSNQNVSVSYVNTLATNVTNAIVTVAISGSAVEYESIRTQGGFYRSSDRTIVFSRDTDPSLATLAPGASGVGAFSFSTLPASALTSAPTIVFTISVSGTRVGQSNVPEEVSASITKRVKVATAVVFEASSLHSSGPLSTSGPVPPRVDTPTTYTIVWNVQNKGSTIAGGSASAVLPNYVSYTGATAGTGSFSYNSAAHSVSWNIGDIKQGTSAQGAFQVSITPSSSQRGSAPQLTRGVSFSGYDRFAGIQVTAQASPVTTETKGDPGYTITNSAVQ